MQHSGGFHHRDISTVFNIPISLWVQNETHLFHKNAQTLVDKTGKRLCIKVGGSRRSVGRGGLTLVRFRQTLNAVYRRYVFQQPKVEHLLI